MYNKLSDIERRMISLLICGQSCYCIMELLGIDYTIYKRTKKSLLAKLQLNRVIELLPYLIEHNIPVN